MKNWKTTLFGLLLAGFGYLAQNTTGKPQQIGSVAMAVAAAALGAYAKDNNATGAGPSTTLH